MDEIHFGNYEQLAAEYYDAERHPTCANFREASAKFLAEFLLANPGARICEVGAGKSLVAELTEEHLSRYHLVLINSSPTMLRYSAKWATLGVELIVGQADRIPVESDSIDILVSSLGDPYNTARFWTEVQRVLRPGGTALFSTPAYEWASAFRPAGSPDLMTSAEFELVTGAHVFVPSYIYKKTEQQAIIEEAGLIVECVRDISLADLNAERVSPKLLIGQTRGSSIVTGYVVKK